MQYIIGKDSIVWNCQNDLKIFENKFVRNNKFEAVALNTQY